MLGADGFFPQLREMVLMKKEYDLNENATYNCFTPVASPIAPFMWTTWHLNRAQSRNKKPSTDGCIAETGDE